MKSASQLLVSVLVVAALAAAPVRAQEQLGDKDYQPHVGQSGKDVIWVPTPNELVEKMLQMARITPNDFVIDLGAGDGRIAIAAAKKFGARSMGIEYNPDMVALATREAQRQGVADRARFVKADVFEADFSPATIITLYLLPDLNLKLRPKILDLKPGTRVVAHQFNMGEWQADETANLDHRSALLWIVPAKAGGNWRMRTDGDGRESELSLTQNFQMIQGQVKSGDAAATISDAKLSGERIRFSVVQAGVRRDFAGRVSGSSMEGTVRANGQSESKWSATRQ